MISASSGKGASGQSGLSLCMMRTPASAAARLTTKPSQVRSNRMCGGSHSTLDRSTRIEQPFGKVGSMD